MAHSNVLKNIFCSSLLALLALFSTIANSIPSSTPTKNSCPKEGILSFSDTSNSWKVVYKPIQYEREIFLERLLESGLNNEDLVHEIQTAPENTLIIGSPDITIDLKGKSILLDHNVSIQGNGMKLYTSLPMTEMIGNKNVDSAHEIEGLVIDGKGLLQYSAIHFKATARVLIRNNELTNTASSAIVISSTKSKSARHIWIDENYIHSPAKGVAHVILIKSLPYGKLAKCVAITNNKVIGTKPDFKSLKDYTKDNEYTADQITLQGVDGFLLQGNYSGWSGSSGYTVSRLSRNGIIKNNTAEMCYEPGFNIGSGFESIELDRSIAADTITLTNGKAMIDIAAILNSPIHKNAIVRGQVTKNVFQKGDKLNTQADKGESIIKQVYRSSENILLEGNSAIDTAIQRKKGSILAAYNIIRSDGLYFINNNFSNRTQGRANKLLSLSASTGYVDDALYAHRDISIRVAGPGASIQKLGDSYLTTGSATK